MISYTLLSLADDFYQLSNQLIKIAYIKKIPGGKFRVYSRKGRNLGTFRTFKEAKKHLKQVEYFKYLKKQKLKKSASKSLDLSKIEDFSYSAIMRQINKQLDMEACKHFAKIYKDEFDKCILSGKQNPEKHCLNHTVKHFSKKYKIERDMK